MHTIQLKINDKVYKRFLLLLRKFNKDEVEIVNEEQYFISTNNYLQKELREIQSGNAKFISQSDIENRLDQII
ncbi:MAG: tRNA pseudouridine synthase A [Bacteroidetes bacterium]|nr:tRNA pseudouridine synthase A [Bacteroidota bacterium]